MRKGNKTVFNAIIKNENKVQSLLNRREEMIRKVMVKETWDSATFMKNFDVYKLTI
jgi:hypothetical protein